VNQRKKVNADIRRKNPQIDKSSFGRLAYLPKAEPLRLCVFAACPPRRTSYFFERSLRNTIFFFSSAVEEDFFLFSQRRRDAKGDSLGLGGFA
jgi:hypothetical protein